MKKINKYSINIRRIKREEMTSTSYDQHLLWSCAYAIKGVDTDRWDNDAKTIKGANKLSQVNNCMMGAETNLYYHNSDPKEDSTIFLQAVIDEKIKYKGKQTITEYVGLGKVNFFQEMMTIYDRNIIGNIEYRMWDALEEMYKQGYYLRDLQPKFILQNFRI